MRRGGRSPPFGWSADPAGQGALLGHQLPGHAEENPNAKMPEEPFFFAKLPNAVVGPDVPVAAAASGPSRWTTRSSSLR